MTRLRHTTYCPIKFCVLRLQNKKSLFEVPKPKRRTGRVFDDGDELNNKPAHAVPLASARQRTSTGCVFACFAYYAKQAKTRGKPCFRPRFCGFVRIFVWRGKLELTAPKNNQGANSSKMAWKHEKPCSPALSRSSRPTLITCDVRFRPRCSAHTAGGRAWRLYSNE